MRKDNLLSQGEGAGLEEADDQLCSHMEGDELQITCCQWKAESRAEGWAGCWAGNKMCVKRRMEFLKGSECFEAENTLQKRCLHK